jgi:hypothetical protein
MNPSLKSWLITERSTPVIARWLCGLLEKLEPPDGTVEASQVRVAITLLTGALEDYKAHRRKDDPQRVLSHDRLIQQTRSALQYALNTISFSYPLHWPCSDAALEEQLVRLATVKTWHFQCNSCGLATNRLIEVSWKGRGGKTCQNHYCESCYKNHTTACPCGQRHHRDDQDLTWALDNIKAEETVYCHKAKVETRVCSSCRNLFLGPPGRHGSVSQRELEELGHCLCYVCASRIRRYDCGHIDTGSHQVVEIEHVEDDNRDRQHIHNSTKSVCRTCARSLPRLNFWNASKLVKAKNFTEVGSQRRYGVELEVCQTGDLTAPPALLTDYWHCKADASLPQSGAEFASVILQGDEGLEIIRQLCAYAREEQYATQRGQKWSVDARSGFHLHVEVPDAWPQLKAIAVGYLATYDLWRLFAAPSRGRCKYCRQHVLRAEQALKLKGEDLLHRLSHEHESDTERRRRWCNWCCYDKFGTVEIRLHQGTLVAEKVVRWVQAHTRFIDWCAARSAEEVLQQLGTEPRRQFLTLAHGPWGHELGRWLRQRATLLREGRDPLQKLIPGARKEQYQIGDCVAVVIRHPISHERWLIAIRGGSLDCLRADARFSGSSWYCFRSEEDAHQVAALAEQDRSEAVNLMHRLSLAAADEALRQAARLPPRPTLNTVITGAATTTRSINF